MHDMEEEDQGPRIPGSAWRSPPWTLRVVTVVITGTLVFFSSLLLISLLPRGSGQYTRERRDIQGSHPLGYALTTGRTDSDRGKEPRLTDLFVGVVTSEKTVARRPDLSGDVQDNAHVRSISPHLASSQKINVTSDEGDDFSQGLSTLCSEALFGSDTGRFMFAWYAVIRQEVFINLAALRAHLRNNPSSRALLGRGGKILAVILDRSMLFSVCINNKLGIDGIIKENTESVGSVWSSRPEDIEEKTVFGGPFTPAQFYLAEMVLVRHQIARLSSLNITSSCLSGREGSVSRHWGEVEGELGLREEGAPGVYTYTLIRPGKGREVVSVEPAREETRFKRRFEIDGRHRRKRHRKTRSGDQTEQRILQSSHLRPYSDIHVTKREVASLPPTIHIVVHSLHGEQQNISQSVIRTCQKLQKFGVNCTVIFQIEGGTDFEVFLKSLTPSDKLIMIFIPADSIVHYKLVMRCALETTPNRSIFITSTATKRADRLDVWDPGKGIISTTMQTLSKYNRANIREMVWSLTLDNRNHISFPTNQAFGKV